MLLYLLIYCSSETLELVDQKRRCKCSGDDDTYVSLKREVQKEIRKDKNKHINSLCEELEGYNNTGNMRKLFGAVKSLSKKFTAQLTVIKDSNGSLLTEKDQVLARWKEYCADLYTNKEDHAQIIYSEREPPPLKSEVAWALGRTVYLTVDPFITSRLVWLTG